LIHTNQCGVDVGVVEALELALDAAVEGLTAISVDDLPKVSSTVATPIGRASKRSVLCLAWQAAHEFDERVKITHHPDIIDDL